MASVAGARGLAWCGPHSWYAAYGECHSSPLSTLLTDDGCTAACVGSTVPSGGRSSSEMDCGTVTHGGGEQRAEGAFCGLLRPRKTPVESPVRECRLCKKIKAPKGGRARRKGAREGGRWIPAQVPACPSWCRVRAHTPAADAAPHRATRTAARRAGGHSTPQPCRRRAGWRPRAAARRARRPSRLPDAPAARHSSP
eukprot:6442088-Prymnesium_polylepis.2